MYHNFISKTGSVILQMMNNITKKTKFFATQNFAVENETTHNFTKNSFCWKIEVKRYVLNRDVHCFDFWLIGSMSVELIGKQVRVNPDMAVFITMNPGYAGRSNLPDNLKKLFRSLAMTKPDRQLIAEVMLYSQGFRMAEKLAKKIVPFFK